MKERKSKQYSYARKKKGGCEVNHDRHKVRIAWCTKCYPSRKEVSV